MTISREAATRVNQVAQRYFFEGAPLLGVADADPEFNPHNYENKRQVRWDAMRPPIYEGLRAGFTANVRPDIDYVNGIEGHAVMMDHAGVLVKTTMGHMVKVAPYANQERRNVYNPIRIAYATTPMKVQGDTLKHMTLFLDTPGAEAAGYVALSRAQRDKDRKYAGFLQQKHFIPAQL